jgi:hypothetical protein
MLKPGSDRIHSIDSVIYHSEKFSAAGDRARPISGATGGRSAAEPADRATRQTFSAAVRRCDDGSIDVEFYKAHAYAIRRAAQVRFAQALRRQARLVLRRAYEFICRRR